MASIQLHETLGSMHKEFIDLVKERRSEKIDFANITEDEVFSGRIWTGRKAAELGLIDCT